MVDRIADDALAIARSAFAALEARDWSRLRPLVDPGALATIKEQAIAIAEAMEGRRPSSPDEIQAREPGMPLAVAEWFSAEERRTLAMDDPAGINALGVMSVDELRSLAPDEVFVRWMSATEMTERLRRATGEPHRAVTRYIVLGVVMEGESTAHVVYRAEGFMKGVSVESLRKTESGWGLSAEGILSRSLRTHFRLGPRVVR